MKSIKWVVIVLTVVLVAALIAGAVVAQGRPFAIELLGANERPNPGDPNGSGEAFLTLNQGLGEICYTIHVEGITLPATAAHIHVGDASVAGPVVVGLSAPDAEGNASGCVSASAELIKTIRQNPENYYVNVHNVDYPPGALRGQLR